MGKKIATFIGARVGGAPTYTPSYIKPGTDKPISAKAEFSIYLNGKNGEKEHFKITAWGKMADVVARGCGSGKEVTIIAEIDNYQGKVYKNYPDGRREVQTNYDGSVMMTPKVGFTIMEIHFGEDGDKQIDAEIANRQRPQFWNVKGHADNAIWKNICAQRNAMQYQHGQEYFCYARVVLPTEGTVVIPGAAPTAGVATQYHQNPNAVSQGLVQPVVVNGVNMGFAPANNTPVMPVNPVQVVSAGANGMPTFM